MSRDFPVGPALSPAHSATCTWSLACPLVWHPGAAPAHCKRRGRLSGRGLVCRHHRTVTRGTAASQPHSALDWATGTRCSAVRQAPQSWHVSFGARSPLLQREKVLISPRLCILSTSTSCSVRSRGSPGQSACPPWHLDGSTPPGTEPGAACTGAGARPLGQTRVLQRWRPRAVGVAP